MPTGSPSGSDASRMLGRPMATSAMTIKVKLIWTRRLLNPSSLCLRPAKSRLVPRTRSSCPRMEPMRVNRTTRNSP